MSCALLRPPEPSFAWRPMSTTPDVTTILQRTTVALTQLHKLLQTAADLLANLHSMFLVHTHQVDPHLHATFPPLPTARRGREGIVV